jgi:DNA-binding XRE family transcriptional regulator
MNSKIPMYTPPDIHDQLPFRAWLGRYLGATGWSQTMLARSVQVSPKTAHSWLTGRSLPQLDAILKICRLFSALFGIELAEMIIQATDAAQITLERGGC